MADSVIRLKPNYYIHVLDNNSNTERLVVGPITYTKKDHEVITTQPQPMILVPPRSYCIIDNPVLRDDKGNVKFDEFGQAELAHGDEEIRFNPPWDKPFPLYPGEKLFGKVSPLQVVAPLTALRLRALRDVGEYKAGEEWLFPGPATYQPKVEVQVVEIVKANIIKPNQALRLRAKRDFGSRRAGEEWLVREAGAYMPLANEEVVANVAAFVLTEKKALHLQALKDFTDVFKIKRRAGDEWLVTLAMADTHIPDVFEKVVGEVSITTLSSRQYCFVLDPVIDGKRCLGKKILRKGECSFFLQPGERLETGIQSVHVLDSEEALLLQAKEEYPDGKVVRRPGDRWMIPGPCEYVPPIEVEIVERRRYIPLDENEGIYIRNIKTGAVCSIKGKSYMLKENEELWEKELPVVVEELLAKDVTREGEESKPKQQKARDRSRVVSFRTPHNSAVQVFDYTTKKSRVVFGPDLVMLEPDEQFTLLSLSGDVPKRPHVVKSLALTLGPDFMTDVVVVETSDHARLSVKLSYNWQFRVDKEDPEKIFNVPDFIGDACKSIASLVRAAVATHTFDHFHKYSAKIIRDAVFGETNAKDELEIPQNGLLITNIDIQSVEPVDQRTRDALQKSVQLAIEITTKSQEAEARHEAAKREQQAKGKLDCQAIKHRIDAESSRHKLLEVQAETAIVQATGQSVADAKARGEAQKIEAQTAEKNALTERDAKKIKHDGEMLQAKAKQAQDLVHKKDMIELELNKARELARIEVDKFKHAVESIGADTLASISQSGPETQAKLMSALGMKGFLLNDPSSPIGQITN